MARETFAETDKPFAMLANLASGVDRNDVRLLEADGIPVLEGTMTGLAAFRHLFAYRDHRALPALQGTTPVPLEVRERWQERLSIPDPVYENEALVLLSDWGVPVAEERVVGGPDDAVDAAIELGYPVVIKTAMPGVAHKSDAGGVRVGLRDEADVVAAYAEVSTALGPTVVVAPMVPPGVEIHLGIVRDPQFGPLALVAAGGVLVEALHDRRMAVPPLDEIRARRLVDRLGVRPMLDGLRGRPPADVDALVGAIVALGWLAHDLGDRIEALDANPVICGPDSCVAVDALVIPRQASEPI
jgi:acyl-CoA synthetase (NDP forming)